MTQIHRKSSRISTSIEAPKSRAHWVTWAALAIALVLVIVRMTTSEALREPWAPVAGVTDTAPRGPGPAIGLAIDTLALAPALLVLGRRAFDGSFRLSPRLSHVPLWLLAGWTACSVFWSADTFAAVVGASHLFAAVALLWAVSQIAVDGGAVRLVSGICFGLLLLLAVQLLLYRFIDVPADVGYWAQHKTEILREHNWDAGSFLARQLEHKLLSGEAVSFFASPNTLAAIAVMLLAVSAAAGIQRVNDGDGRGWWALVAAAAGAAGWILLEAQSKTSIGTPVLGVTLFAAFARWRPLLKRHATRAYVAGLIGVIFAALAVIGHGIYHHGLFPGHFSNSLDFRWKYWAASAKLVAQRPLVGVGFNNFGTHYLSVRLPDAVEEIQDPHNVLVRFAVETGLVGLLLLLAWLGSFAWELTRPAIDKPIQLTPGSRISLLAVAGVALVGIVFSSFVNIDFAQGIADVALEVMRRSLFGLMLMAGTLMVTMRSAQQTQADDRPAPWMYYGIVMAIALFFVHNLIDFSFFEPGPMFASLLLCGVALALAGGSHVPPTPRRPILAGLGFSLAIMGWLAFVLAVVAPIVSAETSASAGDDAIRASRPAAAVDALQRALATIPYNADYAERAARAQLQAGRPEMAMALLDRAVAANPLLESAYLMRAQLEMSKPDPAVQRVVDDFNRVIQINPNDVQQHIQYGQALDRLGRRPEAAAQFRRALAANAALGPDEPRRLTAGEVDKLTAAAERDERTK